jgi:uncharacterized protein (DUF1330 family)
LKTFLNLISLYFKGEQQRINKLSELLKHYGGRHLVGKDFDEILRSSFERADMVVDYRIKYIDKLQSLKNSQTNQKIVKRRLKNIKTNVSVIKLIRKEEDLQKIQNRVLNEFGFKREVCLSISL